MLTQIVCFYEEGLLNPPEEPKMFSKKSSIALHFFVALKNVGVVWLFPLD